MVGADKPHITAHSRKNSDQTLIQKSQQSPKVSLPLHFFLPLSESALT